MCNWFCHTPSWHRFFETQIHSLTPSPDNLLFLHLFALRSSTGKQSSPRDRFLLPWSPVQWSVCSGGGEMQALYYCILVMLTQVPNFRYLWKHYQSACRWPHTNLSTTTINLFFCLFFFFILLLFRWTMLNILTKECIHHPCKRFQTFFRMFTLEHSRPTAR